MIKIDAHCLVKNEENFIWYALNSILPYVDKIMIWDTGSTDRTVEIIESIKSEKVIFRHYGSVTPEGFTKARQEMIDQTPGSFTWIMVLDGDEVWPKKSIEFATDYARSHPKIESIVVQTHNLIGDIYHRLDDSSGNYRLAGKVGHLALRFMNRKQIKGLHVDLPHGQIGYFDGQKKLIQDRDPKLITYLPIHYAHATHLHRSSMDKSTLKRAFKYKYNRGLRIDKADIPQVFLDKTPALVPKVISRANSLYWIVSFALLPLKFIKKISVPKKSGY